MFIRNRLIRWIVATVGTFLVEILIVRLTKGGKRNTKNRR